MTAQNKNLTAAKRAKNDEFYTQLPDIEKELKHYRKHFRNKTVYCNCDDPRESCFFYFFSFQFERLGLKELIATAYRPGARGLVYSYKGDKNDNRVPDDDEIEVYELEGDGDFRSDECIELLEQADIVVTNPPFSLFREYVAQLVEYDKKFLIIGSLNAITYKEIFPLIKDGKLWLGHGFQAGNAYFKTPNPERFASGVYNPDTGLVKFRNIHWYTNLDHPKRHEELILFREYDPETYPTYDNYNAIEVSRVVNIPCDYDGVMGVPITFLDKWNPDQFEIVGSNRGVQQDPDGVYGRSTYLRGKETFKRIFIRKRNKE